LQKVRNLLSGLGPDAGGYCGFASTVFAAIMAAAVPCQGIRAEGVSILNDATLASPQR
jgi:hypothetical protein